MYRLRIPPHPRGGRGCLSLCGTAGGRTVSSWPQWRLPPAAKEAERLKKQLESDPYDTELEERYREMIELQQEYILNAENEKQHEKIVEEAFDVLGNEIDAIHIKDYIVKDGNIVYEKVTVGEGNFNIPHFLGILKAKKPFINVLLEASTPENVKASCDYIRKCYEHA